MMLSHMVKQQNIVFIFQTWIPISVPSSSSFSIKPRFDFIKISITLNGSRSAYGFVKICSLAYGFICFSLLTMFWMFEPLKSWANVLDVWENECLMGLNQNGGLGSQRTLNAVKKKNEENMERNQFFSIFFPRKFSLNISVKNIEIENDFDF